MQDKDQLEKFIDENRESFDSAEPNTRNWKAIEDRLDLESGVQKIAPVAWYWKAAVFILLGAVTYLLVDKYELTPASELETSNVQKFEELETFYNSLIANKKERLESEPTAEQASNYLEVEMKELDGIYADLKQLFLESQPSEQVMERLVHLLRQKLRVMDSQLEIIEREKLPEDMKSTNEVSL